MFGHNNVILVWCILKYFRAKVNSTCKWSTWKRREHTHTRYKDTVGVSGARVQGRITIAHMLNFLLANTLFINAIHTIAPAWAQRIPIILWNLDVGFNTRCYTLVHGFCFFKLFPIGCIWVNCIKYTKPVHASKCCMHIPVQHIFQLARSRYCKHTALWFTGRIWESWHVYHYICIIHPRAICECLLTIWQSANAPAFSTTLSTRMTKMKHPTKDSLSFYVSMVGEQIPQ